MAGHPLEPGRTYVKNFIALAVLMTLTLVAYMVDFGALALAVALLIAMAKATLIIMIFMNVWFSSRLTMVFAAAGFFWFLILIFFIGADYVFPHLGTPIVEANPDWAVGPQH